MGKVYKYSKLIFIPDLREGMVVAESVFSNDGSMLVEPGTILNDKIIQHLKNWDVRVIKIVSDVMKIDGHKKKTTFVYKPIAVEYGKKVAKQIHKNALKVTEDIVNNLRDKRRTKIDVKKIKDLTVKLVDEAAQNKEIFIALINIKKRGNYLFTHSLNVSVLSVLTGISMGLNRDELLELGEGAMLHDVGMCVLPEDIWDTEKVLDENQFFHIKKHPMFGNDILQTSNISNPKIANIIYQHHERIDGSGYPQGLKGDKIHLYAKIVSICDVFDAMNSPRRYRGRYLPYDIMGHLLRNAYVTIDPEVMKAFVRFVSLYPVSSFVKLNTGETCIVVGANEKSPIRPILKVVLNKEDRKVTNGKIINLIESDKYYITQPVKPAEHLVDAFEDY